MERAQQNPKGPHGAAWMSSLSIASTQCWRVLHSLVNKYHYVWTLMGATRCRTDWRRVLDGIGSRVDGSDWLEDRTNVCWWWCSQWADSLTSVTYRMMLLSPAAQKLTLHFTSESDLQVTQLYLSVWRSVTPSPGERPRILVDQFNTHLVFWEEITTRSLNEMCVE